MRTMRIAIVLCLLLGVVACNRQSSNPQKDIVGSWKSTDNKHLFLTLREDGTCQLTYAYLAPSDFEEGKYTLSTDASGINVLTLTLRRRGLGGGDERRTKSFEAAVYSDKLVLGSGSSEIPLARVK